MAIARACQQRGLTCAIWTSGDHPALAHSPCPIVRQSVPARHLVCDPAILAADGERAILIDDVGELTSFAAPLIVSPHPGAEGLTYHAKRVLRGPAYAPLRRQFVAYRRSPSPRPLRRVWVSQGGSRPIPLALPPDVAVVRPPGPGYFADVARLMVTCDAAIVPAGMSALEAMCLGLPVYAFAKPGGDQGPLLDRMVTAGLAGRLADWGDDPWARARRAFQAVDGWGAWRLARWIAGARPETPAAIRRPTRNDRA